MLVRLTDNLIINADQIIAIQPQGANLSIQVAVGPPIVVQAAEAPTAIEVLRHYVDEAVFRERA